MTEFRIVLPDQSVKVFTHAPTALEVAETIGPRLAKETLGVKVNQDPEIKDLTFQAFRWR
jgi:threonyl-tRNA synthetase